MTQRLTPGALVPILVLASFCAGHRPPATAGPRYPDYPRPDVPASLSASPDIRQSQDDAWVRLQSGDLRGATRGFNDVLQRAPAFYPAEAGLGYVAMADEEYKQASAHFTVAIQANDRYLPALLGQADAQLALHNDLAALTTFEQILRVDPNRDLIRSRMEVLRIRVVQSQIEAGDKARRAGRLDEAESALQSALDLAPQSAVVLRELGQVETARGDLEAAERHLRLALQADDNDPDAYAALAAVLAQQNRLSDAAAAYGRAIALDPRPEWRDASDALRARIADASVPAEYRAIPSAASVTRAQTAATIGLRLGELLTRSPGTTVAVATDIRGNWAAPWIMQVTQAGVMDVFPNHTFQPGATLRRSDLAQMVAELLRLASGRRPADLTRWRAERPQFSDLPPTHLSYPSAALAVAAGAMTAGPDGRFGPNRPVAGADLLSAVDRILQIASR